MAFFFQSLRLLHRSLESNCVLGSIWTCVAVRGGVDYHSMVKHLAKRGATTAEKVWAKPIAESGGIN